jgi:hypothetical protein
MGKIKQLNYRSDSDRLQIRASIIDPSMTELASDCSKGSPMNANRFLRRKAASEYLRDTHGLDRAPSTLAKLAVVGGGPIFRRAGRFPLYSTDDLDGWAVSLLSGPMRTTSEGRQKLA